MFKRIITALLLLALSACAPINLKGTMTEGEEKLPVTMTATGKVSDSWFQLEAELPEGTTYSGEIDGKDTSTILFSPEGRSMKCDFNFRNPKKSFNSGGEGKCRTSEGQTLSLRF